MADYYTQFAEPVNFENKEAAEKALGLYKELNADGEATFDVSKHPDNETMLIIEDIGGGVDKDQLCKFMYHLSDQIGFTGRKAFSLANTCSKHRLDGFGGTLLVFDFDTKLTRFLTIEGLAETINSNPTSSVLSLDFNCVTLEQLDN
jgi:hypothetical protein